MTAPKLSRPQVEKLLELARAATPGPWAYEEHGDTGYYGVGRLVDDDGYVYSGFQKTGELIVEESVAVEVGTSENACFIATFNPSVIIDLCNALLEVME